MDDENLEELYENLADPDDEEDEDEEEIDDEEYDEDDNIAEDPGDDDDWWHKDEEDTIEIVDVSDEEDEPDEPDNPDSDEYDDDDVSETTEMRIEDIEFTPTYEIASATTGEELLNAIADVIEDFYTKISFGGIKCNIEFVSSSEFESIPYEDKYPSTEQNDNEYEETTDDEEDDGDDEDYAINPLSSSNTVYFIYDYEGEQ